MANCKSQEYNYYHYDVKDGLSGNTVYSIVQDKDGFLWFGTETGLSRFDGTKFKNYTVDDGLNDNEIISLFVDSKNRIWIFPFKNAVYYYFEGKIHNKSNDTLLRRFNLENEIFKACEDKDGNIFFIEHKRIHILSSTDKLEEIDEIKNKNFTNNVCGIDDKGVCSIYLSFVNGTDHGVSIFEYDNSNFVLKGKFQDSVFSRNSFEVNPFYTVARNGSHFEIYSRIKKESFRITVPKHFHTISYLNDSAFMISTFNKTLLYNVNQEKVVDSFLFNKVTNNCFSDKENNVWFATSTQGLYRLPSTRVQVYRLGNGFNFMPVYAFSFSKNFLYIGSDKDVLWTLHLGNNKLDSVNLRSTYAINNVLSIQEGKSNEQFLGSNIGVYKFNGKQTSVYLPEVAIKSCFVYSNVLLVATDRGVFEFPTSGYQKLDTVWHSRATFAIKMYDHYYIGTLNGLYSIDNKDPHTTTINWGSIYSALKDKIICLKASPNGDVWIGTENNGLICLRNNKIFCHLSFKDGLISNLCRNIFLADDDLWLGTDKGISRINISRKPFTITNYTTADGLDCEIINCIYANGDSVFAGTPYGITFFNAGISQQKSICKLKMLDIQSASTNWYFKQDSIHLASNDNFLRFEYAGISFVSAGDITYHYQLKGLSDEWLTTNQNILEFQSLSPGDYALNMYAENKYGVKSKTLTIHFTKAKHYWQVLWVRILFFAVAGLLIWLIVRARVRAVKRKANTDLVRERRINELEQMALRAQMNPHFIFNSINSIQQYVFSGNVAEANEYITNFSSLVRQTLYMSGKKFITLAEEVKYLQAYLSLEQAKYEHCFNFNILVQEMIDENMLVPPLLIQPFVENSIRHGVLSLKKGSGRIAIQFYEENKFLYCVVDDNGVGRTNAVLLKKNANPIYESKGIGLVRSRIESLNSLYHTNITVAIEDIEEGGATGTRVIIKFPVNYDE